MDFKELYFNKYRDEALDLLKKLVSYKSVLDEYKEGDEMPFGKGAYDCLNFILNYAKKDGFKIYNSSNYAGHIEFGDNNTTLGILAHLDVVPVDGQVWESDPFTLSIRDNKMYGRGVADDKGPVVASYIVLKMLKDLGFKPNKKIRLILGCDEESGSRCIAHYFKEMEVPDMSFSPDADFPGIFGEKGNMSYDILFDSDNVITSFDSGSRYNIVPANAYATLNIDLKDEFIKYLKDMNLDGEIKDNKYYVYGKSAHAMCPSKGINAATKLMDFIAKYSDSKLAKFVNKYFSDDTKGKKIGYNDYDPLMLDLTSNFALVKFDSKNGKIGVNCRLPKDSDIDLIKEKVSKITKEYGYQFNVLHSVGIHYVDPNSFLMSTLYNSYKKITNDTINKPQTIGGGTYAHELKDAVAFGPLFPGREDVCHIANEYMYIEDFDKMCEIYFDALYELTK